MATETRAERRTNHSTPQGVPSGTWQLVPHESHVGFRVKKMGLYHVKGRFRETEGNVELAPGRSSAAVEVTAGSITTRMPPRDLHLRSGHFLDVKSYPKIAVSADRIDSTDDDSLTVPATVEIRGQRREVELAGHVHAGGGDGRLVLHLQGTIDRHDFGIRPPQPFEMVVGRRVELDVELALAADDGG